MNLRERGWILNRWGPVVLLLGLGACAGGAPSAEEPTFQAQSGQAQSGEFEGPGCVAGRAQLTVADSVFVYIEPEDLMEVGSSYVVAGAPSYTWTRGPAGEFQLLTRHRHLAARFTLDGRATLIERPVQDSVGSVRTIPLGGERWGVLFDIEEEDEVGRGDTAALWYAEHDGTGWSLLEPVPMPEGDVDLDMYASSELVRVGEDLVWSVPGLTPDRNSEVHEYTRRDGRWQHRVIGNDWVTRSAMAYDPRWGLWMARSGPNANRTEAAVWLYRYGAEWELMREARELRGSELALDLAITFLQDGPMVTWRMSGGPDHGAYALRGTGPDTEGTLIDVDPEVLQVIPLRSDDDDPRWIVTHVNEAARRLELRILAPRPLFGAERIASVPSPYPGFFAALARSPEEAIVVGAEASFDPADPFVRSLILRLSTSC